MAFFNKSFVLEVWGEYACFTRPEMKVERVSYDVITPSAARAIFEAIFWKPAIRWHVRKIEILSPIRWASVRRNEIGAVMSDRTDGLFIEDYRQQKAGLILRDVRYRIHAEMEFIPVDKRSATGTPVQGGLVSEPEFLSTTSPEKDENPGKYYAIFERRARKGQCFNQPYFGCREFSCAFRYIGDPKEDLSSPVDETRELGFMLYDMDFSDLSNPKPAFFRAHIEKGIVNFPDWNSEEVKK
ncbi:MAG: type I-C CRISPR-associated protein Cas5 [Thermotogaceae bacterium]|nr:type I-C CRISPR-associated protein Cas5 [Thermotogota bacterium]NLZ13468.1 type I-C CRISPR-associated protein Cas5 [Thermotogaceae bacterium]MDD8052942.1 type I-C CRISPR-associated protein Cas5c [Thermotogota bacterium]HPB87814.1 type I-C CRISPR-associated protein Cas5c [Thermotogota bacterium]HQC37350.1 type I-C CRISPR-associated protein Cas5c [Thermotogota bacterium]